MRLLPVFLSSFKTLRVGWLGLIAALLVGSASAQSPGETRYAFDLPAQPLADALPRIGEITGDNFLFDARVVAGKQAAALRGSFTTTEALDTALAGSGLVHQRGNGRTIAIRPEASLPANATTTAAAATDATAENAPAWQLDPLRITADGAQRVLVVTQNDLDSRQAVDLDDTLSIDPAVAVGGSTGIAQKIYVRNLGEGLLNITVDGATQSGSLFHHTGRMTIEPELLKQVEVQPGVGNASDGPGALGGAIRFITKDPADLLRSGERAGGQVKYGYFSNTDGYRASVTGFGRANDTWSGLVSLVSSEQEEITDGRGNELAGSDSRQEVFFGKVVGELPNGQTLRASFEHLDEVGNKLRRPEWAPGPGNPSFYMEASRRTGTIGYGIKSPTADWLDLQANLSYTDADLLQIATFGPYTGAITSLQFDVRNRHKFGAHEVVYGIDYRDDEVTAGPTTAPKTVREDSTVTGLFAQGDFAVAEKLTINAGARFDMYSLDDRLGQSFDHEGFSPNLGVTYDVNSRFSVNASVATAYRGPDINDAFRVDIARNDPGLDAEKAINYELRLLYKVSGLQLEAGGYINRIDDVITNTLPWSTLYTNAGELKTEGVFARASYHIWKFGFNLQYNHADTTINGQTATRYQYSSLVSRIGDTWVGDVSWRPNDQLDFGWNARLVQRVSDILIPEVITEVPDSFIDKPGYVTHDFYARWRPHFARALTFNLTVKNAFDKQYLSHASVENLTAFPSFGAVIGAPEAGRDIRASVTIRF